MARKLRVSERDSGHPRQYTVESYDDDEYSALSWDDYYVNAFGYFGNIGPHVFAAAPDLLEALAKVFDSYGDSMDYAYEVKAALAKARGEA